MSKHFVIPGRAAKGREGKGIHFPKGARIFPDWIPVPRRAIARLAGDDNFEAAKLS